MRLSVSLAVALLAAAATPIFAQNQEPMRQQLQNIVAPLAGRQVGGKTYRDWVEDLRATDPALKESAIQAMVIYASEPQYIKDVRKKVGSYLIEILSDTYTTDVSIKVNAALAVGTIGLDEKDMDKGVSALTRLLSDNESIVRLYATTALSNLGSDARSAIPNLAGMLKDKASWEIRRAAVAGLTRMAWDKNAKEGGPDPRAFRALTTALGDRCLQVRQEAAKGYIYIGPPVIPADPKKTGSTIGDLEGAIKALDGLVSQRDKSTGILGRVAILRIDPRKLNNPQLVERYTHEISKLTHASSDTQVRIDASFALTLIWQFANGNLAKTHPDPKTFIKTSGWGEVMHVAVQNLGDKDNTIVCWACSILGTMGPAAEKAIPDLEKLLARTTDDTTKKTVERALASCHGKEAGRVGAANRIGQ